MIHRLNEKQNHEYLSTNLAFERIIITYCCLNWDIMNSIIVTTWPQNPVYFTSLVSFSCTYLTLYHIAPFISRTLAFENCTYHFIRYSIKIYLWACGRKINATNIHMKSVYHNSQCDCKVRLTHNPNAWVVCTAVKLWMFLKVTDAKKETVRVKMHIYGCRGDSRFAPNQWETALFCNDVSHWLSTSLELALMYMIHSCITVSRITYIIVKFSGVLIFPSIG